MSGLNIRNRNLRDGNQALAEPMDGDTKFEFFQALLRFGYKEIEISYPSASDVEYDFTRRLIEEKAIPDDVWIQVMAPCREDLVTKTIESVRGAKKVIVHIHLSTSECFRNVVFRMSEDEMIETAVRCMKTIRSLTKDSSDEEMAATQWVLEFTPENFQDTSVEYALRICEAVKSAWEPTTEHQIIFNLPSTVEMAMPNVFADQIEYFGTHISEREKVCISLHNHNDRGCAVATSEMGQLAGADRVEGCLFGNGERTGNVDLVTLALNLYTQGVNPGINFGEIDQVAELVEKSTKIPLHLRAPYAGKLTFCTFTGTHQDAIRKGYKKRAALEKKSKDPVKWVMPYLGMDPGDLGKKHESIIRLSSQSGKGGISWLLDQAFSINLPRELEVAFAKVFKTHSSGAGCEITKEKVQSLFRENYMLDESVEADNQNDTEQTNGKGDQGVKWDAEKMTGGLVTAADPNGSLKPLEAVVIVDAASDVDSLPSEKDLKAHLESVAKHVGYDLQMPDGKVQFSDNAEMADTESKMTAVFVKVSAPVDASANASTDSVASESSVNSRSSSVSSTSSSGGNDLQTWGVGFQEDPTRASLHAVLSAIANVHKKQQAA